MVSNVEFIHDRMTEFQPGKKLHIPMAGHCSVHLECSYIFVAGGFGYFANTSSNVAFYQHYKAGMFQEMPPMKVARANHACFVKLVNDVPMVNFVGTYSGT